MRCLLVAPRTAITFGTHFDMPTGLGYIASSLKAAGHDVHVLNCNLHQGASGELVTSALKEYKPDVFMTGGLTPQYPQLKYILDEAKSAAPDIPLIIGGGIVTSEPELMLNHLPAGIGVLGEGEVTVVELLQALEEDAALENVPGLVFKDNKGLVRMTRTRNPIKDIDAIPMPDYDALGLKQHLDLMSSGNAQCFAFHDNPRLAMVVGSRSCPYRCTFCFHPLGNKYRQRSIDSIIGEITHLINTYDINIVIVQDELFSTKVNKRRIMDFCERIAPLNIHWGTSLRADSVDKTTLEACHSSGCKFISYGIESASNAILKSLKKKITRTDIEHALNTTYASGIGIVGNIIFGDKEETEETINESVDWFINNKRFMLRMGYISPYPGSELYRFALSQGIIKNKADLIPQYHSMRVNLTRMPDETYFGLINKWTRYTYTHVHFPGEVRDIKLTALHPIKGPCFSLRVLCPHCNMETAYGNMTDNPYNAFSGHRILFCRLCGQQFNILPFNQELDLSAILSDIGDKPFAVLSQDDGFQFPLKISLRLLMRSSAFLRLFDGRALPKNESSSGEPIPTSIILPLERSLSSRLAEKRDLEHLGFQVHVFFCPPEVGFAVDILEEAFALGMPDIAHDYLDKCRRQFPFSPILDTFAAKIAPDELAREMYDALFQRWPGHAEGYMQRAKQLIEGGNAREASCLLEVGLRRIPGNTAIADALSCLQETS